MNQLTLCSLVALLTLPLATGCGQVVEEEFASAVVSSALETPRQQSAAQEVADSVGDDCSLSAEEAAAEAASRPQVGLYPQGCAAKSADGADLHVELDACTGPFGRVELMGGLDASLEVTGECQLRADIVDSGDLTANGRALSYSATADVVVSPEARDVTWRAAFSGTTRRGRAIEQTSDLSIRVDHASSCLAIAGTTEGHVAEHEYNTEIRDLAICPDACPSAGSVEAEWQGRRSDRRIRIEFDGSSVAHVTGWSGREFDVDLICED
jgi:hypothetical protein